MSKDADFDLAENKVMIVAEAGVNHNGDVDTALRLCDAAHEAGADAVKFQTWREGECTGRFAVKVPYLDERVEADTTRFDVSRSMCLSYEHFHTISDYCREIGITFLSTPDGLESLRFLAAELEVPAVKIGSTEITNLEFVEQVAALKQPVLLSTGLSNLGEVERCVEILRRGRTPKFVLLHCTSQYPAPAAEVNLRAMVTLREAFHVPVGFSDHSEGTEAAIAAVGLGAVVLEKHFTLDREMPGPDHAASLEPSELSAMVHSVRKTEIMLGDGIKQRTPSEEQNLYGIRRGVVAASPLAKGTILRSEMLTAKRPYRGIEPYQAELLSGFRLNRDLQADEPITWEDIQ